MFVYRLTTPLDEFDDLVALTDWLHNASPAAVAWMLRAVLALRDAADQVGWRGDMRHLPSVSIPAIGTNDAPHLVVKQDDNGATFVVSDDPLPWADTLSSVQAVTAPRRIAAVPHPTATDIAEAMAAMPLGPASASTGRADESSRGRSTAHDDPWW